MKGLIFTMAVYKVYNPAQKSPLLISGFSLKTPKNHPNMAKFSRVCLILLEHISWKFSENQIKKNKQLSCSHKFTMVFFIESPSPKNVP